MRHISYPILVRMLTFLKSELANKLTPRTASIKDLEVLVCSDARRTTSLGVRRETTAAEAIQPSKMKIYKDRSHGAGRISKSS